MTEKRVLPRYRGEVSAADLERAEQLAARAAQLTDDLDPQRQLATSRERDRLIDEANRLGLSRDRIAALIGRSPGVVDIAIARVRG